MSKTNLGHLHHKINKPHNGREGIIVPLLRRSLFYFGGAKVDYGAKVDEVSLIYIGTLVYFGTPLPIGGQSRRGLPRLLQLVYSGTL